MNKPYPVVDQRSLVPVPPRRLFGSRRTRSITEIPQGDANHRLVYRIGGDYVLDNAALPLDSPEVLAASHVSLVDVAQNVEVVADLEIPSRDASMFTLHATFVCTVTDAPALVREGAPHVKAALRAYIKGHHRLFELGLDFPLAEINHARRKLNAQLKAYTTLNPPIFIGLSTELASVELLTPDEVATLHKSLREQERQHTLKNDETKYQHFDEIRTQRHKLDLDATQRDFERIQYEQQKNSLAADPESALTLALSNGEITAKQFADEIMRREEEQLEVSRAELRQQREWEQENAREQRVWEQESTRQRWDAEREDRRENLRLQKQEYDRRREDDLRRAEWTREDKNRHLEANITIIRELAQRGFLDTVDLNMEKVVNNLLHGERGQLESEEPALAELPVKAEEPTDEDRRDDVEMKEEDVD